MSLLIYCAIDLGKKSYSMSERYRQSRRLTLENEGCFRQPKKGLLIFSHHEQAEAVGS